MANIRTCDHTMDDGSPCGAIPVHNTPYCYFHRKYYQPEALPGERGYKSPLLESHESIQLAATHLYQSFMAGRIPLRQAQFALNVLRLASKTITSIDREKRDAAKEQTMEKKLPIPPAPAPKPPAAAPKADVPPSPKPPQPSSPAYKGDRLVDPYGCLAHLKK